MKAAVVFDLQQGPVWSDFRDPQPGEHQALVEVRRRHQSCSERPGLR
jgi:D-arabinose 1-dehydrogenase-like Zn-dependent alcohol dehydrogenase